MKYYSEQGKCTAHGKRGPVDLHHIKARGRGKHHDPKLDEPWNLIPLCRRCHVEVHQMGMMTFARLYPTVAQWLKKHGWYPCSVRGKWARDEKEESEAVQPKFEAEGCFKKALAVEPDEG